MFNLDSTVPPPVQVTISGVTYNVPRFLNEQLIQWVAERHAATRAEQLAVFGDNTKAIAEFIGYWQPAPVDTLALLEEGLTPDGSRYVIESRLKAAGVPDDVRKQSLSNMDGATARALAFTLLSAGRSIAKLRSDSEDPGAAGNPTTGPAPTSGDSPTITDATNLSSPSTAQESNQAA